MVSTEVGIKRSLSVCVTSLAKSPREDELLSLLAIGSDTRGMARQMSLSEHTILWGSITGSCLGGLPGWDHR